MAEESASSGPNSDVTSTVRESLAPVVDPVVALVPEATSLKFATVSALSILVAATVLKGVWAGIIGVVGATFALVSLSIYAYIWYVKQAGTEEVNPLA
jgi:uncharacterized protein YggT (Ycf19 family)